MVRYKDPIPTKASKASVSKFAEDVANVLGYEVGQPIELIVSQLGGAISYKNPVGERKPESILVQPDREFTIYLPSLTSASRDRFTIAHELGHFFLHFPLVEKHYPGDGMRAYRWLEEEDRDLQRCEWEANWFAGAFVMPERHFKQVWAEKSPLAVANFFGVSEKACNVRAKNLDLS